MSTATLTRRAAAHTGRWAIDPCRAQVGFSGRTSFLTPTIAARFAGVEGTIEVEDERAGELEVVVDVTSMSTGNRAWDEVIAAFDPFDAARFPVAVYRGSAVRWQGERVDIAGHLTLRGVTRAVPLQASYAVGRGSDRMVVRAGGQVDRSAFGVSFDVPGVGALVPRRLRLDIDVDVVRR